MGQFERADSVCSLPSDPQSALVAASPGAPSLVRAFPAAPSHAPPLPRAMLPALLFLACSEGLSSLFAGLGTACASLALSNGLYYAMYALFRDAVLRATGRRGLGGAAALPVAAAAGALNVLCTNPLWVLVTRLQTAERGAAAAQRPAPARTPLACARELYREGGLPAFWKGTLPALLMVSNPVVQFAAYEWLLARPRGMAARPARSPSWRAVFAAGAASKLAATLATYPFLVIKARRQGRRGAGAQAAGAQGPLQELLTCARQEGLPGLYRGLDTKLVQTVLAAAILFTTKEAITKATRRALSRSKAA